MTSEAIFDRFDQDILDNPPFSQEELSALERNFKTLCENTSRVSKAFFIAFLLPKGGFSLALAEGAGILFDSLCYLSTAPLQAMSLPHDSLTFGQLKRALIWTFPSKASSVITNTSGYRERSPADHRRLLFQSLAASRQRGYSLTDKNFARALAAENARHFPPDHRGDALEDKDINFDDDGDEMYHDVLDFLASTQPYVPPTYAEPRRDGFRDLATRFHRDSPSLLELAIPRPRLKAFLALLLATNLRNQVVDDAVDADLQLQNAAQSVEACFHQYLSLEAYTSGLPAGPLSDAPDECTWPVFNFAISKLLPHLFESLYSLLSMVFFDQPCRFDANTGYAKPGVILTLPRMVQLEFLLFNSISMPDIRRLRSSKSAAGLVETIKSIQECALLVISGHTEDNETYVFGVFIPRPPVDGPCIQSSDQCFDEAALLFQLSPTHDVFRGKAGAPAWRLNNDGVSFGDRDHGAALALDASLTNAQFTHRPLDVDSRAVYSAKVFRDDFEIALSVAGFEIWSECAERGSGISPTGAQISDQRWWDGSTTSGHRFLASDLRAR